MELTTRQAEVLRTVVEAHVEVGQPVGSKWLAEHADLPWKPSTIRAELARLEELGLLQHPHTSAGRVPTDSGYRYYVDELLEKGTLPVPRTKFQLTDMRREVEETLRATTEQLSQVTNLLAIVSAPPIATTTIRHIEVLLLQPQVAIGGAETIASRSVTCDSVSVVSRIASSTSRRASVSPSASRCSAGAGRSRST